MPQRDYSQTIDFSQSIAPKQVTTTQTGSAVDLQNRQGATVTFSIGAYTDGTHTPIVQDSPDNSTWTTVAAASLQGTLSVINSTSGQNTTQHVGYLGDNRYVRPVIQVGSATTGMLADATVVGQLGRKLPAENS